MPSRITNAAARAAVAAVAALLNGGQIRIYTGSQPVEADAAVTGTLLATCTLAATAFGAATDANPGGRVTANPIAGDASGTAGWFRAVNSSGVAVIDGNITATGGGGDMTLASVALIQNGTFDITSWTITMPEG